MQIFAASSLVAMPPDPKVFLVLSPNEYIFLSIIFTTFTIFFDLS